MNGSAMSFVLATAATAPRRRRRYGWFDRGRISGPVSQHGRSPRWSGDRERRAVGQFGYRLRAERLPGAAACASCPAEQEGTPGNAPRLPTDEHDHRQRDKSAACGSCSRDRHRVARSRASPRRNRHAAADSRIAPSRTRQTLMPAVLGMRPDFSPTARTLRAPARCATAGTRTPAPARTRSRRPGRCDEERAPEELEIAQPLHPERPHGGHLRDRPAAG